ncbi:PAS domain S-box protein [Geobacter sp. AOG2]|uniref:PAS domain S-box protein n=1 Tax=Geobacter sp. AOG2 TaxID=1566347 RepID=UPI001CC44CA2|nr:PAS domain S-box protein [Geobacter sp. AOG2]GFE62909.1 hypothetical protein AOG2_34980 [Geobacter sp. AOG2]
MKYTLKELLDVPRLRQLLDAMDEIHRMPSAIVDMEGDILTATAWQDICTKFHRVNPETERMCIKSDTHIGGELDKDKTYVVYRCPMGLVDAAMPIIIEGQHLGNVFSGQVFMEPPDEEHFVEQAGKYGFDEAGYLEAMRKVPYIPEEMLRKYLGFIHSLAQMLAEQGLQLKRLLEAEKALRLSDKHHRSILSTAIDGIWLVDVQGRLLEVNEAYCRMSGYSEQELLTMCISDLEDEETPQETARRIRMLMTHGHAHFVSRHRRRNGTVMDVEVCAQYHSDEGGRMVSFIRDITEKLRAERTLSESEKKYRQLFHNLPTGFALHEIVVDEEGKPCDYRFLEINPAYERLTGLKAADLIGKTQLEIMPNSEPYWAETYGKVALTGESVSYENFSGDLGRYFHVKAYSPEPGKFATVFYDITDRKLAEEAIRASEDKFSKAFRACPALITISTMDDGRYIDVNDVFYATTGYRRGEVIGRTSTELGFWLGPGDRQKYLDDLNRRGSLRDYEIDFRMRNGEVRNFLVSSELIEIGGKPSSLNFIIDVTEQKRMVESLRITRFSIDHSSDGIFWMTPDSRITDVNEAACRSLGYSREELLQLAISDIDPTCDRETWRQHMVELHEKSTLAFETEHATKDGRRFPVEIVTNLIEFDTRQLVCSFVRNITDRKQAEAVTTRFMLRQRAILDNLPMMAWLKDTECRLEMVNEPYAKACGCSIDECIGKTDLELFPRDLAEGYLAGDRTVMATGERLEGEALIPSPLGLRWHFYCKTPIFSEQGRIVGTSGIALDIADRKKHEEALHSILEWTPISTLVHRDGSILYANPIAVKTFGASDVHDLVGQPILDLIRKDFHQISLARKNSADQGKSIPAIEFKFIKLDGSEFDGEIQSTSFNYDDGKAYISCILDITDRKKAEEDRELFEQQLQHTQKLESLGVLSGGIAHDFNNILAVIIGYCELMKMNHETAGQYIQEIEKAAERAAGLCRQMLAYAGKTQLSMARTNMWLLVDEMVSMLKATLPQNAVIKTDLAKNIPLISADASQIRQVVMNLIINASEAIGTEQGEIQVALAKTKVMASQPVKDYNGKEVPPGEYVCLTVSDTGCGMDEETRWRIFEPFFTTKFAGRGLGMSAVLGIINSHDGALQLFSRPGQGTTFEIYLPVPASDVAAGEEQARLAPAVAWQGSGTVLLVEDEDMIRQIARIMLQQFGFTVMEAVNGKVALELYRQNAADIALVVTDMGMPVMDGCQLFRELKKLNPGLPIIVSSGFGDAEVISRIGAEHMAGMISKPYNPNQLREVLRKALEGAPSAPGAK